MLPMRTLLKKAFLSLLRIAAGVPIVGLIAAGLLLLLLGATMQGRSVGLSAAIFGGILYCSVGYWSRPWFKAIRRRFYAVLLPAAALLYLVPMVLAPNGGKPDARVRNCYLHGQPAFWRYGPGNVVPEIDQLKVGIRLLRLRDVDSTESTRLCSLLLPIYSQIDNDADFRALGRS